MDAIMELLGGLFNDFDFGEILASIMDFIMGLIPS